MDFIIVGWGSGRMPSRVAAGLIQSLFGREPRAMTSLLVLHSLQDLENTVVR